MVSLRDNGTNAPLGDTSHNVHRHVNVVDIYGFAEDPVLLQRWLIPFLVLQFFLLYSSRFVR